MRQIKINRANVSSLLCVLSVAAVLSSASAGAALGGTHPYFKVNGGDVVAGGAFNTDATSAASCTANNYQYSKSPGQAGGILTYANAGSGSASQYAAMATGQIEGKAANLYGFYSASSSQSGLTFANTDPSSWGGFFDGSVAQADCIPDYYDAKQASPAAFSNLSTQLATGQYKASGNPISLSSSDVVIPAGAQITVFINGSVYINHNIAYPASYADGSVPKFALVVKGNIFIDPSVHQLDGLYIAQPSSGSSDGKLWTCHSANPADNPLSTWYNQNCNSQLTINGAVIAQQVNLTRVNGDLGGAPAETINYTPAMVVGGSFFNQPTSSYKVDSLVNLPPVF